jgi:hypothetical protein
MRAFGPSAVNATKAAKDTVAVTVHMSDGMVMSGDLYVYKTGQRLQDLLNDATREFLPLKTSDGVTFVNRNFMKTIAVGRDDA